MKIDKADLIPGPCDECDGRGYEMVDGVYPHGRVERQPCLACPQLVVVPACRKCGGYQAWTFAECNWCPMPGDTVTITEPCPFCGHVTDDRHLVRCSTCGPDEHGFAAGRVTVGTAAIEEIVDVMDPDEGATYPLVMLNHIKYNDGTQSATLMRSTHDAERIEVPVTCQPGDRLAILGNVEAT